MSEDKSVSPLSEEACTAGWCCGKTCIRHESETASTPHVRNPNAGVCVGCARRLLSQLSIALRERDEWKGYALRCAQAIGVSYEADGYIREMVSENAILRERHNAALVAVEKERDAAIKERDKLQDHLTGEIDAHADTKVERDAALRERDEARRERDGAKLRADAMTADANELRKGEE